MVINSEERILKLTTEQQLRSCRKNNKRLKEKLKATNDSKPDMPNKIKNILEEYLHLYNDKLINHRCGVMPLNDQAVNYYECNIKYLKWLLGLRDL